MVKKIWFCKECLCLHQCRTVKITILGDEGVPVQVDGEAWIQPPGYIRIHHKNRTQTLTRDRVSAHERHHGNSRWSSRIIKHNSNMAVLQAFENTLKSWEDKQRGEIPRLVSQHASQPEIVSEEETTQISLFGQAAGALIHRYTDLMFSFIHSKVYIYIILNMFKCVCLVSGKWQSLITLSSRNWLTRSTPALKPWTWCTPTPKAAGWVASVTCQSQRVGYDMMTALVWFRFKWVYIYDILEMTCVCL